MLSPSTLTPVSSLAVCSACNYLPTSVMWHPQKSDIFVLGKSLDSHQANQGRYFDRTVFAVNFNPPSLPGDEGGTVALVDTKNPDSALSAAVHTRGITGFAFSAHGY